MKIYASHHLTDEKRIFNYKLSHACHIVENAFGILANRFRCLPFALQQETGTVKSIVLACVCLHNLMWIRYSGLQNVMLDQKGDDCVFVEMNKGTGQNFRD